MMNDTVIRIEKEAIPFTLPANEVQLKTLEVKYTLSGSIFKMQQPIFKEGSAEELLHFLFKINQAQQKLGVTTSQKLESGIEQLLQGSAHNMWNTIKAIVTPNVNTLASLTHCIEAFRRLYFPKPAAI